jgi:hypothetical protein
MLLASYKVIPELSPLLRIGFVSNSPPKVGTSPGSGSAFLNPIVGATYGIKPSPDTRLALFLGFALPLGSGGGNTPDPATAAALSAGISARSSMDNSMFAVNYLTTIPGIDFAYVAGGFTAQAEATLFELVRARGSNAKSSVDSTRTNFTSGLHAGYFLFPELSVGAELRYQLWLSNSTILESAPQRDTLTFAAGLRAHVRAGENIWIRPGIAYARGLDKPMTDSKYNIVQLDVPVAF